jgi:aminopeptidase N
MFGQYPLDHMAVTEIPRSHGQAFSGLLHLSWGTFQEEDKFYQESFRSHEVSHQWWGHIVGWKTYHDQWLSEGFATYSGLWFAQVTTKDNKKFFDLLKRYRDDIIKGDPEVKGVGSKAGPIWLGYRLDNSKSFDYDILVYEKGAYILHMLRNMLMDFGTRSDEKFIEMLRDYATAYRGKSPTTRDFQEIVEKHVGTDMDWFFNQWVYGTEIPKYTYSHSIEKVGDKYQVTLKVKQERVSPGFKMLVPVVLNYKPEGYSVFKVWVDQPEQDIKLPLVPLPVSELVFNPYYAVLCEVELKEF